MSSQTEIGIVLLLSQLSEVLQRRRYLPLHDGQEVNHRVRPFWRQRGTWICIGLISIYAVAIFLDLPSPAGTKNIEDAPHWWNKIQGLRGWSVHPQGWVWAKIVPAPLTHWLVLLGLGVSGMATLWWLERRARRQPRRIPVIALISLIFFAFVLQLGTLWLKSSNPEQLLLDRITNNNFTGYFSSALQIDDLSAFFSRYDVTINSSAYCYHCQVHPPGPVLYYWILLQGVDRLPPSLQESIVQLVSAFGHLHSPELAPSAIIVALLGANLILLAAAAIVIPLYGLARQLGGPEMALPLTALGAVLPGLILMSPEFDQLFGALSAGLLYLSLRGLATARHNAWWGLGSGLLFAFSLYWSFGLAVLALPVLLLAFAAITGVLGTHPFTPESASARSSVRATGNWLLGFGLGAVVPWVLLWGLVGFDLPSVLQAVGSHQVAFLKLRPYAPWLVFNLIDYLQFLGLPIVFATLVTLGTWRGASFLFAKQKRGANSFIDRTRLAGVRWLKSLNTYAVVFWFVVIALDLSGATRGEVGRLWIFLMPLALLPIFQAAGQRQLKTLHIHALLSAQFAVCLLLGGNWWTP